MGRKWAEWCFLAASAVHVWLAVGSSSTTPPLLDEFAHVSAGVSHWDRGGFSLYREDPPLVRSLTALPVYISGARTNYQRAGVGARSEWNVGLDFIRANGPRIGDLYFRARLVVIALAVSCGVLIFWWAREAYGDAAAAVSSALWLLDPSVLAFSATATVDIGAAAFGCPAAYTYWGFLRGPTWTKAIVCGVALGLAEASKFSILALYPAWLVVGLAAWQTAAPPGRRLPAQMALIILASLISLNAVYQFTGSFRPLRSFSFKSQLLSSIATTDTNVVLPGNRFRGTIAADFPAPLPRDYVLGLDSQKWEEEIGLKSLQDGHLVQGGRWYSPLVTSTFKLPLGSLILVAASAISVVLSRFRVGLADTLAWVTGLSLVGLLCSQTGCNWAVRYILPALPLLFLAVGRVVQVAWGRRFWRWAVIACLVWNGIGLVRVHPFYLSYGNELVGGMDGAQRVFIGSNYDWGQDLGRLRRWLDEHADGRPVAVTYYGILDPEDVGIRNRGVPVEFWRSREAGAPQGPGYLREPFYWAISSNVLNGLPCWIKPDTGSGFEGTVHSPLLKPENAVARAGSSIYVFSIVPSGSGSATRPTLSSHDLSDCVVEYQAGPLEINATP